MITPSVCERASAATPLRNRLFRFRTVLLALLVTTIASLALSACFDREAIADEPSIGRASLDEPVGPAAAGRYSISGPYTHENLTVFLIHGAERTKSGNILTLQEALAARKIVVHETGSVNELSVQNLSDNEVFIQSGEIVKGGKQDRVMAVDMILPPKSGRVPIASFCVEQGRWSARDGEDVTAFSSSGAALSSKELKIAARYKADQSAVWSAVASNQDKLSSAVGVSVASARSSSSLQLTLENENVAKLSEAYVNALQNIVRDKPDVIGYAFAVNNAINSAEVYGSSTLFGKLWPKMLHAAAVEAVSERGADAAAAPATVADVQAVISDAEKGEGRMKTKAGRASGYSYESERNVMFETRAGDSDEWVHRSYITK